MTDKELLELAAKAAGLSHEWNTFWNGMYLKYEDKDGKCWEPNSFWNPLQDDGDALRLAVKLQIDIDFGFPISAVRCVYPNEPRDAPDNIEKLRHDPYAATRRAIVLAAAEIGKSL